jgi:hypothetical protein
VNTGQSPYTLVAQHDDMSMEVIADTIAFCTETKSHTDTLSYRNGGTAAGILSECIPRKRNKCVRLGYTWIRG